MMILPLVSGDDSNLCSIADGYWYTDNPWGTSCPSIIYGVIYDTTTTHNGAPTFRIDPVSSNWGADHLPIAVNVGDRVVMSCWIKTGGSSPEWAKGARMGMDWYTVEGGWHRIGAANNYYEAQTGLLDSSHDLDADSFIGWGSDWTYLEWDFYIQPEYESDGYYYPLETMMEANYMLPWIQVCVAGYPVGAEVAWFSDFKFVVNPTSPTPTPTSIPTPTPTPNPSSTPVPTPNPTLPQPYPHPSVVYPYEVLPDVDSSFYMVVFVVFVVIIMVAIVFSKMSAFDNLGVGVLAAIVAVVLIVIALLAFLGSGLFFS